MEHESERRGPYTNQDSKNNNNNINNYRGGEKRHKPITLISRSPLPSHRPIQPRLAHRKTIQGIATLKSETVHFESAGREVGGRRVVIDTTDKIKSSHGVRRRRGYSLGVVGSCQFVVNKARRGSGGGGSCIEEVGGLSRKTGGAFLEGAGVAPLDCIVILEGDS